MAHYLRVTDRIYPKLGAFFPAGNRVSAKKFSPLTLENLGEIKNESMHNILCEHRSQLEVSRHVFVPTEQLIGSLGMLNGSSRVLLENSVETQYLERAMSGLRDFLSQSGASASFELSIAARACNVGAGNPLGLYITRMKLNRQYEDIMRIDLPSLFYAEEVKPSFIAMCHPYFFDLRSAPTPSFASGMVQEFI